MIIAIANQKGGSGKSTLAINIATHLLNKSSKVLVLDTDPQHSVENFTDSRESIHADKKHFTLSNRTGNITESLKQSVEIYDHIIIDTRGSECTENRKAMLYADLLIVPTTPSQLDFDVLNTMLERIKEAKDLNEGLNVRIVMNKINPNPFLQNEIVQFAEAIKKLNEEYGSNDFLLCKNIISDRISYKRAIADGLGITEYSDQKAKQEFESLLQELGI